VAGKRHKKHKNHDEGHVDERWLLTYADLITLLMALFMVLWSISSVNVSKFESLQRSLAQAFSGRVMPGGQGIKEEGGSDTAQTPAANTPMATLAQITQARSGTGKAKETAKNAVAQAAQAEQAVLKEVKKQVEAIARNDKLSGKIKATISKDGLHIRITTDDLLFDSGSAVVKPKAAPVLAAIGKTLSDESLHQIVVKGHTDNVPIHGRYQSNWNLSADRAANVVLALLHAGVKGERLSADGRADQEPIASNATAVGRSINRRVEMWLPRNYPGGNQTPSLADSIFPKP
jgi:chemotaxis protein MotB